MKQDQLLDQILPILHSVKDDKEKLQRILDFLLDEIYKESDDKIEIPEKYREAVQKIAESIDCGLVCYLNPDTLEIEDNNLQKRLVNVLSNRKPFANFKNVIENSAFRELWFTFKQLKLEELVWENLSYQLNTGNE